MSGRPKQRGVTRGLARALTFVLAFIMVFAAVATVAPTPTYAVGNIEGQDGHEHEADMDNRAGNLAPTAAQQSAASTLGASVRWNKFGTPASVINYGGYLGTRPAGANAASAARGFLVANAALFGLSGSYLGSVSTLELVSESPFRESAGYAGRPAVPVTAWAVIFRQKFGSLRAAHDGLVTVGVSGTSASGWKVAYVSSSLTRSTALAAQPSTSVTPVAAWLTAAKSIGRNVAATSVGAPAVNRKNGWTQFTVAGFSHPQRARLVALPTPTGVRPAYEVLLLDNEVSGGHAEAFTAFVDAATNAVLLRNNNVQQLANYAPTAAPVVTPISGTYGRQSCGRRVVNVGSGFRTLIASVTDPVVANDITVGIRDPRNNLIAFGDTAFSPEVATYTEDNGFVAAGAYTVEVCPFSPDSVLADTNNYAGTFTASEQGPDFTNYPPKWKYYRTNPNAHYVTIDTRPLMCWDLLASDARCYQRYPLKNLASRAPWDTNVRTNTPTFTTVGNNANTREAWLSPLTPGGVNPPPTSPEREYIYPWANRWYESTNPLDTGKGCSPTELTLKRNDIDAAVTSLFANHNRMHDWSYFLGFTERNFNAQESNFGITPPNRENDPEVGNAQAGAVDGGPPTFVGRDNANQITFNDGIAPITNMYLWQPIAAGFYAPCVDGDYDFSVIGHEYGHMIQNRMVAGPDSGLSGHQPRAMGESWSDLTAVEYLAEHPEYIGDGGYPNNQVPNVNPFAVGPYVTGSKDKGIRNYGMNTSDLNYSNLEYDPNGVTSPHADGEIWSATNYDIRQGLIAKYNATFPASNQTRQQECADNDRPVRECPGNRRWFQILMDAFLLQQAETTMLDARDAYLAADQMRFNGANQVELWRAFARRGMGEGASSPVTMEPTSPNATSGKAVENRDPIPNFESFEEDNEASVTFRPIAQDGATGAAITKARVYIGRYEARAVPIADTDASTPRTNRAFFVPGTYDFLVVAPGYGHYRFRRTLAASETVTLTIAMPTNWASITGSDGVRGATDAKASGDGINKNSLIDETETSNFARPATDANGNSTGTIVGKDIRVTVKLSGAAPRLVKRVQVSAFLRPQRADDPGDDDNLPGQEVGDTEGQGRVTSVRKFEVYACNEAAVAGTQCSTRTGFTKVYTSASDAFKAFRPRPVAPDQVIQSFTLPTAVSATHLQFRPVTNHCTGAPDYEGDQDADPLNNSDCQTGSTQDNRVRAAEFQVFTNAGTVTP